MPRHQPTPYAEVNNVLDDFIQRITTRLDERIIGIYLFGSLTYGGFRPGSSDIDISVVTKTPLDTEEDFDALTQLHREIVASDMVCRCQLEVTYPPLELLQKPPDDDLLLPYKDRGCEDIRWQAYENGWIVQRYMLYTYGQAIMGPDPATLANPVSEEQLRQATHNMLLRFLDLSNQPGWLDEVGSGYRCYLMMTMCRVLYTMQEGDIVSKDEAIAWAQDKLPDKWARLTWIASRNRKGSDEITSPVVSAFIAYMADRI